jgi:hypothetical protein
VPGGPRRPKAIAVPADAVGATDGPNSERESGKKLRVGALHAADAVVAGRRRVRVRSHSPSGGSRFAERQVTTSIGTVGGPSAAGV